MIKAQQEQTIMEEDNQHGDKEDKSKQKGNIETDVSGQV